MVNAENPADPVMTEVSAHLLPVWIKGSEAHRAELCRRFDRAPKPMYYRPEFLLTVWADYLASTGHRAETANPDAFLRFGYARLLESRQPRYAAMARWGVTVTAEEVAATDSPAAFDRLIAAALDRRNCAA